MFQIDETLIFRVKETPQSYRKEASKPMENGIGRGNFKRKTKSGECMKR